MKVLFTKAFSDLPFSKDDELKILDIGCGLGFLSCVCAEYYPNSTITGFDTFEDASLKNSSLTKAKRNAKILGYSERITFQKKDFFRSDYGKGKFDLFVSNLVFHNFGRKRLDAYERLGRWATSKSYVLLGDLFVGYRTDSMRLKSLFNNVQQRPGSMLHRTYRLLVLSEPKGKLQDVVAANINSTR